MPRACISFSHFPTFKDKLYNWSKNQRPLAYLDSNTDQQESSTKYIKFDFVVAVGKQFELKVNRDSFSKLKSFLNKHNDWAFGHFSYDLKNELELLQSENVDHVHSDELYFFIPEFVFTSKGGEGNLYYEDSAMDEAKARSLLNEIEKTNHQNYKLKQVENSIPVATVDKEEYINAVTELVKHIKRGDIYEVNYCQYLCATDTSIDSSYVFLALRELSHAPFSAYYCFDDIEVMCSSPERFVQRDGERVISQPIKGTSKRGSNTKEDALLKEQLKNDPKERSENIMIVDLVRNDLSITAKRNSVKVEELCEVYSFKQVHQLISTIACEVDKSEHSVNVIEKAFPMGSMTGAPKLSAMRLIEEYESHKRSIFSGSIGYFQPNGDFDFNVVIRSVVHNSRLKQLMIGSGGAITAKSDPEKEYEESMLKSSALQNVLSKGR